MANSLYEHEGVRLWLAADGETVVEEGDPRAATLLIAPGQTMPRADAERYGLLNPKKDAPKANKAEGAKASK